MKLLGTKNGFYYPKFELFISNFKKLRIDVSLWIESVVQPILKSLLKLQTKTWQTRDRSFGLIPFTHVLTENFRVVSTSATKVSKSCSYTHDCHSTKSSIFLTFWSAALILKNIFTPQVWISLLSLLHLALAVAWYSPLPPDPLWISLPFSFFYALAHPDFTQKLYRGLERKSQG